MSASSHSACINQELAFQASSLPSVRDSHLYLCSVVPQATAPVLGCNKAIRDVKHPSDFFFLNKPSLTL